MSMIISISDWQLHYSHVLCSHCCDFLVPGAIDFSQVVVGTITSTTAVLSWQRPPMPNGDITGYTVELVVITPVSLDSSGSRKRRQTAANVHPSCIPMESIGTTNVSVETTSLTVTVGKLLRNMDKVCIL